MTMLRALIPSVSVALLAACGGVGQPTGTEIGAG